MRIQKDNVQIQPKTVGATESTGDAERLNDAGNSLLNKLSGGPKPDVGLKQAGAGLATAVIDGAAEVLGNRAAQSPEMAAHWNKLADKLPPNTQLHQTSNHPAPFFLAIADATRFVLDRFKETGQPQAYKFNNAFLVADKNQTTPEAVENAWTADSNKVPMPEPAPPPPASGPSPRDLQKKRIPIGAVIVHSRELPGPYIRNLEDAAEHILDEMQKTGLSQAYEFNNAFLIADPKHTNAESIIQAWEQSQGG